MEKIEKFKDVRDMQYDQMVLCAKINQLVDGHNKTVEDLKYLENTLNKVVTALEALTTLITNKQWK